jgi:hypothetical protein
MSRKGVGLASEVGSGKCDAEHSGDGLLSRELFALDMSDDDTTSLIRVLCEVMSLKIRACVPNQPLDELIECLRAARMRIPDLFRGEGRIALAISLGCRYSITHVNDDYEEAASLLDEILTSSYPGNSQDERAAVVRADATNLVASLAIMRFNIYQTPENLEEAIYRIRTGASLSFNTEDVPFFWSLQATSKGRLRYFGSIEGVEKSSGFSLSSRPLAVLPENLKYHQALDKVNGLLFMIRNNDDTTKIDEAVEKGRSILLTPRAMIRPLSLYSARSSLRHLCKQRRLST